MELQQNTARMFYRLDSQENPATPAEGLKRLGAVPAPNDPFVFLDYSNRRIEDAAKDFFENGVDHDYPILVVDQGGNELLIPFSTSIQAEA